LRAADVKKFLRDVAWALIGIGGFLFPLFGADALGISMWVGVTLAWIWLLVFLYIRPD
jgi:hypothetical protein